MRLFDLLPPNTSTAQYLIIVLARTIYGPFTVLSLCGVAYTIFWGVIALWWAALGDMSHHSGWRFLVGLLLLLPCYGIAAAFYELEQRIVRQCEEELNQDTEALASLEAKRRVERSFFNKKPYNN